CFRKSLEASVNEQARALVGADLVIAARQKFSAEEEELLRSIGGEQSREVSFASMVYFPQTGGTRLVQIRALDGDFPFYGRMETDPASAARTFRGVAPSPQPSPPVGERESMAPSPQRSAPIGERESMAPSPQPSSPVGERETKGGALVEDTPLAQFGVRV